MITSSTIANNMAVNTTSGRGGGIFNDAGLTLNSTIVAANTATVDGGPGPGPDIFNGGTIEADFSLIGDTTDNDISSMGSNGDPNIVGISGSLADPKLGPLRNNGGPTETLALLPDSPAIDRGTANGLTTESARRRLPPGRQRRRYAPGRHRRLRGPTNGHSHADPHGDQDRRQHRRRHPGRRGLSPLHRRQGDHQRPGGCGHRGQPHRERDGRCELRRGHLRRL